MARARPEGLYVHLPFCARRCPYCDFATAGLDAAVEARFLEALAREVRDRLPAGWRPRTLYLGGGTPAELTTRGVERLVELLGPWVGSAREVTLEANPRTLLPRKLRALRAGLGVNRVSLGAQSFQPELLKTLGRVHRPQDVVDAVRIAREAGVEQVSLDLIFAVPGQTREQLEADLAAALALAPEHLSTYCLTVEPGTPYASARREKALRFPGSGAQARGYGLVRRTLRAAGFQHYEVSSFARPGRRSLHNRLYWRNGAHYAVGNGAASHLGGVRTMNHRDVLEYVQAVEAGGGEAAIASSERLAPEQKVRETAYLALRTSRGIQPARFQRATGVDPRAFFAAALERLTGYGLLEDTGTRIRLTGRGVSLADAVARELL